MEPLSVQALAEEHECPPPGVGGIIRDVLAGEPSILLRPELYVTAAALAAGLFVLLLWLGAGAAVAAPLAVLLGFGLRAFAIVRGLKLPAYRR